MNERSIQLHRANIVGTIHTPGGVAAAARAAVDIVELRVDSLPAGFEPGALGAQPHPVLLTVRREDEGGGRAYGGEAERIALYERFLPFASAVDVEARSLPALAPVLASARAAGVPVVLSYHDFQATPPAETLREWVGAARAAGADVVKIAAVTEHPADVARLLDLLEERIGPLAVMGMGTLGRASRLLFAKAGSVLNYGWLDQPQVPGQWSAEEFAALVARA